MIASPCNKVCVMNPESGLCRGCYRTLDEIARWGAMEDAERGRIMAELSGRGESCVPASAATTTPSKP